LIWDGNWLKILKKKTFQSQKWHKLLNYSLIHTKPDQRSYCTVVLVTVFKEIHCSKQSDVRKKQWKIEQNRYIILNKLLILYTAVLHNIL